MAMITLTSDYGFKDPYRGIVHGVLASLAPDIRILDLSHGHAPGNLLETAFVVGHSCQSFPAGTVHLILNSELDGKGRWLAMEREGQFFIAADNGVLSLLQQSKKAKAVHLIEFGEQNKSLFPARDFLAKAAIHLANGGAMSILGKAELNITTLKLVKPNLDLARQRIVGHVIYIDHYGNLHTNIKKVDIAEIQQAERFEIRLPRNRSLTRIASSYQDIAQDGVLALINSLGLLEIAYRDPKSTEVNGANSLLGMRLLDEISIEFA
jgi:S-adenosylmethionine hydrolase